MSPLPSLHTLPSSPGPPVSEPSFPSSSGKITAIITNDTPRLAKKFNYRVVWNDGTRGPAKLAVDNYGHGANARFNSWVILTQNENA